MAEDFQDRTEQATSKKLDNARKKGRVAQSRELTSSSMLFVAISSIYILSSYLYEKMIDGMDIILTHLSEPIDSIETATYWLRQTIWYTLQLLTPFLAVLFVFALAINIAQVGFVVSTEGLNIKWSKINIFDIQVWKKIFSSSALMRLLFGLLKLLLIAFTSTWLIIQKAAMFSHLMQNNSNGIFFALCKEIFHIGFILSFLLMLIGISDWMFQKWKFAEEMKMTKHEIKEEYKQSEGDPKIKSKIRSIMHSFISSRMKSNVPKADVIIANPVHYAIAIRYDAETMSAPICIAKGARKMAISIKELAKQHKIPIVENPPLARALYKSVDVGMKIPQNFYHAIAEILAYVYRLNQQMEQKAKPTSPSIGV